MATANRKPVLRSNRHTSALSAISTARKSMTQAQKSLEDRCLYELTGGGEIRTIRDCLDQLSQQLERMTQDLVRGAWSG